jgi:hypothetical protein
MHSQQTFASHLPPLSLITGRSTVEIMMRAPEAILRRRAETSLDETKEQILRDALAKATAAETPPQTAKSDQADVADQ